MAPLIVGFRYVLHAKNFLQSHRLGQIVLSLQAFCRVSSNANNKTGKPVGNDISESIHPSPPLTTSSPGVEASKETYLGYLARAFSSLWSFGNTVTSASTETVVPKRGVLQKTTVKKISRTDLINRTIGLVSNVLLAENLKTKLIEIEKLTAHFAEYPNSRFIALRDARLSCMLLRLLKKSDNELLKECVRRCLSVLGYVDNPKGPGIRILSIDGGGTRGMMCLEVLQNLEDNLCGSKVSEVFDYIIGVSTGAIIAALITGKGISIKRCKEIYMELSRDLFDQGRFSGVSGLLTSYSYYNTKKWVRLLKHVLGEESTLLDSCNREGAPKLAVVSSIANAPTLQPFIFRNYDRLPGCDSHFRGGCNFLLWEAVQASAAAPGYFEEVALGSVLHQDGGILANNPTAIAVHEAKLLWPCETINCVVSVGSGRTITEVEPNELRLTIRLQDIITRIVDSATDTELVHLIMRDLLPANTYFRFNPYMSFPYTLDEIDPEKLQQMGQDAQLYLRRNHAKLRAAANKLLEQPSFLQQLARRVQQAARLRGFLLPRTR